MNKLIRVTHKKKLKEIKRIKEAKRNGQIYISPAIFGDNALDIQGILNGLINENNSKKESK